MCLHFPAPSLKPLNPLPFAPGECGFNTRASSTITKNKLGTGKAEKRNRNWNRNRNGNRNNSDQQISQEWRLRPLSWRVRGEEQERGHQQRSGWTVRQTLNLASSLKSSRSSRRSRICSQIPSAIYSTEYRGSRAW